MNARSKSLLSSPPISRIIARAIPPAHIDIRSLSCGRSLFLLSLQERSSINSCDQCQTYHRDDRSLRIYLRSLSCGRPRSLGFEGTFAIAVDFVYNSKSDPQLSSAIDINQFIVRIGRCAFTFGVSSGFVFDLL